MISRGKLLNHCSAASPKKKKEKKKLAMEITKKLNITDVERRLLLPENCLEDLRSDLESDLKFQDEEGRVWIFRCRASPGGRSKAAFYGDWFSFVREKGLSVGDVVVIISDKEKNIAAGGYYKIKIKKSASKH